jgi:hypothetical protein
MKVKKLYEQRKLELKNAWLKRNPDRNVTEFESSLEKVHINYYSISVH